MNNIRELRQAKGWTMRQLADRLSEQGEDVHFTTVGKIERSNRLLTVDWTLRLARALDVSPADIKGTAGGSLPNVRSIPVIGMVAAGQWREAIQQTDDFISVPIDGENLFALVVDGDSMDMIAPEGTRLIVDPQDFELKDGGLYVVMNGDGETTFKRFRASPPRLEPLSHNPTHQPIVLGRAHFTVVGRVVGQLTLYR